MNKEQLADNISAINQKMGEVQESIKYLSYKMSQDYRDSKILEQACSLLYWANDSLQDAVRSMDEAGKHIPQLQTKD